MKTIQSVFTKTLLAASIALVSQGTHAAAFALIENSASGQGSSYAGAAAIGEDASTIYFNPAAMTRLSGQQIIVAGHVIMPSAKFTDEGSTNALGQPLNGHDSSSGGAKFIPNFYYSAELPNGIMAGVGINVPFGLGTEYDDNWRGRYHTTQSGMKTFNINPALAWKVSPTVSLGFGLNVQYLELDLRNDLDSALVCNNLNQGVPGGPGCTGLTPMNYAQDSRVKLTGDSLDYGWNAGILIEFNEHHRMGIAYRSAIKHTVEGKAEYDLNPVLQAQTDYFKGATGFNIVQDTDLTAVAEMPESFSLSFVADIDDKWTALFDWTWTGWSVLDTIVIVQKGGVPGQESSLDLAYKNSSRYSAGVYYQLNEQWLLRTGVAYDETPIRSPEATTPRIPGNDRTWLSFGAGWKPASSWSVDVAYTHIFVPQTDINNNPGSASSGATLKGYFESSVDIVSLQGNFYF